MGFRVQGSGFRVYGLGFRAYLLMHVAISKLYQALLLVKHVSPRSSLSYLRHNDCQDGVCNFLVLAYGVDNASNPKTIQTCLELRVEGLGAEDSGPGGLWALLQGP